MFNYLKNDLCYVVYILSKLSLKQMGLNGFLIQVNWCQNVDEFRSFFSIKIFNKFLYFEFNQLLSFLLRNIVMKECSVICFDFKLW